MAARPTKPGSAIRNSSSRAFAAVRFLHLQMSWENHHPVPISLSWGDRQKSGTSLRAEDRVLPQERGSPALRPAFTEGLAAGTMKSL